MKLPAVAWQYRAKDAQGGWTRWMHCDKYRYTMMEGLADYEVRALAVIPNCTDPATPKERAT